jgi:hypothetical protein
MLSKEGSRQGYDIANVGNKTKNITNERVKCKILK